MRWWPPAKARALPLLQALLDGEVQTAGEVVLQIKGDAAIDLATGKSVRPLPEPREDVVLNNRVRRELATAIAALRLTSDDRATRLAAAKELQRGADEEMLPAIRRAAEREQDAEIKALLMLSRATIELGSAEKPARIAAIRALAESRDPNTKTLLLPLLEKKGGEFVETDSDVRSEAELSLRAIEGRLATGEMISRIFSGISLGSILLLAALGLAITYGLMGVINMAHGELIMVGAYATYVVQNLFRSYAPAAFDAYLVAAVPVAFAASAATGIVLERTVIRFLYGRPLETLLATWGISLILIQAVRTLFGAQNVQVENPAWMSGGVHLLSNVVLPYSRIVIIAFAAAVVALIVAAAHAHAAGAFRSRRDAEPGDGELRWACRRAASTPMPSASAPASPGSPAARCRRSAMSVPISDRAISSTRSWSSCWAASGSSPAPCMRRWASASRTSSSRRGPAPCWRRSRCSSSSSSSSRSVRRACSP